MELPYENRKIEKRKIKYRLQKVSLSLSSLQLTLEGVDPANVADFRVAHLAEFGNSLPAAGSALAVDEERSGFVMQEIDRVVDFFDGNIAAPADVSAAVLFFRAHIEKDGTLSGSAAVDFIVNIY